MALPRACRQAGTVGFKKFFIYGFRFLWFQVMATVKRFEDLEIWQEARRLVKEVILISKSTELKGDFRFRD